MPKGQWTPPEAGDAPQEVKDILKAVYSEIRDKQYDENPDSIEDPAKKESAAEQAWTAVKNAGWKKAGEKWTKQKHSNSDMKRPRLLQISFPKFAQGKIVENEDGSLTINEVPLIAAGTWTDAGKMKIGRAHV
jgi:cation transport regulator ChaB